MVDPYTLMMLANERCDVVVREGLQQKPGFELKRCLARAVAWFKQRVQTVPRQVKQVRHSTGNVPMSDMPSVS